MDIDLGNKCSKNAYEWAKKTFTNRTGKDGEPATDLDGAFSNMVKVGNSKIGISSDGIGTKIELAERTQIYDTLGYDLVAMVVDDLIAGGFEPMNLSNILDVDLLDYDIVDALMRGLHDASNKARITVTGGEIAELGSRINGYGDKMHFNWCSTVIGILHNKLDKPINGSEIKVGDSIVSFRSRGFRSNGFSLLRRIMTDNFGDEWHNTPYDNDKTWGEVLLTPSLIFSPILCDAISEGFKINGIAHITGGGIKDNFSRVLKSTGLGADLDNLFEPTEIMSKIITLGKINRKDAYTYWNMGNGMLVVVKEEDADGVVSIALENNYQAKICGRITDESTINIR